MSSLAPKKYSFIFFQSLVLQLVILCIFNFPIFSAPFINVNSGLNCYFDVLNEDIGIIDKLIKHGDYYVALEKINNSLSQKNKCEPEIRMKIRKSIVLTYLSKGEEAEKALMPVFEQLKKRKLRKSEAQIEAIYAQAKLEFFQGKYLEAETTFFKALNLKCNFPREENSYYNDILSELSLVYLLIGKYSACDSLLEVASNQADLLPIEKAKIEEQKTYSFYEQSQSAQADSVVQNCKKIREQILGNQHHLYADALEFEGSIKESQGLTAEADSLYSIMSEIRKNYFKEEHVSFASSLNALASVLWIKGENEKAIELYNEGLKIRGKLQGELHPEYVTLLNNIAVSNVMLGKYNEGLSLFLDVKEKTIKTVGKDNPEYGTNLNNLAFTYFKLGQYRKTKDIYLEALNFRSKKLGEDHIDYLTTLNNVGLLYSRLGEYSDAEKTFLKCKQLCAKNLSEDHPQYGRILNNLAAVYIDLGDYVKCEDIYIESLMLFERLNGKIHDSYATVKSNLGTFYRGRGRIDEAQEILEETVEILKEVHGPKHERYAKIVGVLGLIALEKGDLETAQNLLEEASEIKLNTLGKEHIIYGVSLANLASLHTKKGNYAQAEKYYLEALDIESKKLSPTSDEYIKTLKSIVQLFKLSDNFQKELVYSEKLLDSQLSLMESGLDFLSENQKNNLKKNTIGNFSYAKDIALRTDNQKYLDKIYNLCLYEKGLLLNSSISTRNFVLGQNDSELLVDYNELTDLKNLLLKDIQANRRNQFVVDRIDAIEKKLAKASAYFRNEQLLNKIDVNQIRETLQTGEVAIEFTYFKDKEETVYLGLVANSNKDKIDVVRLFNESDLVSNNKLSRIDYVNAMYSDSKEKIKIRRAEFATLNNLIWKPLMPYLNNANTIYYSGAGILQRLNLEAIPLDSKMTMGEKYKMENLASTRNVVRNSENNFSKSAFIVGGVNYNSGNEDVRHDSINRFDDQLASRSTSNYWKYLRFSKVECTAIKDILDFNKYDVKYLNEGFATEDEFKQLGTVTRSPQVIHLATHGFFYSDPMTSTLIDSTVTYSIANDPMLRSGLVLSGANTSWKAKNIDPDNDGILTAFEVANMNLTNTELVVLSACETGLGDISGSEGVYGLQRAFKKAGAKYLIMSLWKIPDEETSDFMSEFYNAWQNEDLSIRDAFKKSQVVMREKYKDPYRWAGFVLIE